MDPHLIDAIRQELEQAREALAAGNDGKARACCRRAVAKAVAGFHPEWGQKTSVQHLHFIANSEAAPQPVRKAALRLTTNVRFRLSSDFPFNPFNDARIILQFLTLNDFEI